MSKPNGFSRGFVELTMEDETARLAAFAADTLMRGEEIPAADQERIARYVREAADRQREPTLATTPVSSRKVAKAVIALLSMGDHGVFPAMMTLALYLDGRRKGIPAAPSGDIPFVPNSDSYYLVFRCVAALAKGEDVRREDHQELSDLLAVWDGWSCNGSELEDFVCGTRTEIAERIFDYLGAEQIVMAMVLLCLYLDKIQAPDDGSFPSQTQESCQ